MKQPSQRELTRRRIRWQQGASQAADEAHSKKAGYQFRPKPSMPKMPWDDQPKDADE
jgi:hypothetical protein